MNNFMQTGVVVPTATPSPERMYSPMSSQSSRAASVSPAHMNPSPGNYSVTSLDPGYGYAATATLPGEAGGFGYQRLTPSHRSSPNSGDAMTSPFSGGSNSGSPPCQMSPTPYVKSEPARHAMHPGMPRLHILEQPQERFRFRYESELGGTHGQLAGRSGSDRRSFPMVKLEGYYNKAYIKCELFTVAEGAKPPVPHVHTLQGRFCSNGVAEITVDASSDFTATFQGLGIIHTAKKAMVEKIMLRKLDEKNAGPGWAPSEEDRKQAMQDATIESQQINMNRVSLRFRALYEDPNTLKKEDICQPIFSDPIYNGKSAQTGELKIVQLSEAYSPCTGNKEIWLLVERVRKTDIRVRFFEEDQQSREIWSAYGKVSKCHHQYAIICQTPPYRNKDLRGAAHVLMQLERPSDGCVSEPKRFQFTERDQRATKRMTIQQEPSDHKRTRTVQDPTGIPWTFNLPQPQELPELLQSLQGNPNYERLTNPHQQMMMQGQQQVQQAEPQQLYPMQQQSPHPSYYSSPGASSMSPPMSQETMHASPPHQANYGSPHMQGGAVASAQDPTLALGPMTMKEFMPEIPVPVTQMQSVARPTGHGLGTNGGQVTYGTPFLPESQTPDLGNVQSMSVQATMDTLGGLNFHLDEAELRMISENYGAELMSDGVQMNQPNPHSCAPRGGLAVRGIGGDRATAVSDGGASTAEKSGTSSVKGGAGGADDLARAMGGMSLGRAGSGGDPPQQPPQQPHRQTGGNVLDMSRPEVKLAYGEADRLYLFAATGSHQILLEHSRFLMGMQNSDGDNPLHVAVMYGKLQSVADFLKVICGLPADTKDDMINSPNGNRQTPLHIAVLRGDLDCARLLLGAGAHCHLVDCDGNTVIHMAARIADPAVLQFFLQHLQQDGSLQRLLQQTNYQGFTALHVAVLSGNKDAVKQLVTAGADVSVHCDTEGRSPLHLAVENQNIEMAELLLMLGAQVDAPTFGDVTPLHVACKLGSRRLAALLVAANADPYKKSVERQTLAGSGTESEEEDEEEADEVRDYEEEERLDAFLYAEMSGDPQIEQILRRRVHVSPESAAPVNVAMPTPAHAGVTLATAAAAAPVAVAAGAKKDRDGMDSGMDSGLGITQELTSEMASGMTSSADYRDPDVLPQEAARRLAALLDPKAWKGVADLMELDQKSLEEQPSPTAHILRCVKKYDHYSLATLSGFLECLELLDAKKIVDDAIGQ